MSKKAKDGKIFLDDKDLQELEKAHAVISDKEKDILIAKLKQDKAKVELNLLSANYTLKSKEKDELDNSVKKEQKNLTELREKHLSLLSKIRKKWDLPDKFGFDPITGEVIK